MNLYVIRHGQTDWNIKNLLQGSTDIELNSRGIEQAYQAAEIVKHISFSAIYSSPLKRTLDTAKAINEYHHLEIITDSQLIERGFGDFEGTNNLKNMSDYWNYELNLDNNNVENIQSFFKRVYNFLLKIYSIHKDSDTNILLVTHGGVGIAINAIINNIKTDLLSLAMKNCEFKIFENIELTTKGEFKYGKH